MARRVIAMAQLAKKLKKPRNGEYFVALIVGARWELAQTLKQSLARIGVYQKYVWLLSDLKGLAKRQIPGDVDVVCVLTETSIDRRDREQCLYNGREAAWSFAALPQTSVILRQFEANGFDGSALILEDIEAPPPVVEEPKQPEMSAEELAELEALTRPEQTEQPKEIESVPVLKDKITAEQRAQLVKAGETVRRKRGAQDLSTAELARMLNCSGSAISSLETGKATPSDAFCDAIEKMLELPPKTIPRLSTRKGNAKVSAALAERPGLGMPPKSKIGAIINYSDDDGTGAATVKPVAPVPAAAPAVAAAPAESGLDAYETLMVQLTRIQRQFPTLGIARIEITTSGVNISQATKG